MKLARLAQSTIGTAKAADAEAYAAGSQAARSALASTEPDAIVAALVVAPPSMDVDEVRRGVCDVVGGKPVLVTNASGDEGGLAADFVYVCVLSAADAVTGLSSDGKNEASQCKRVDVCKNACMLRGILDTLPFGIFWKHKDGTYLGCNKRFAKNGGLKSPAEVVGRTDHDFVWAEYAERYAEMDHEVIASGRPRLNFVEPVMRPNGKRVWIRTSKFPLRDSSGEVIGFLGAYEDVSELRAALGEITEGEGSYREMFNASNDAMFIISTSGMIVDANERACELLGYTHAELVHMTIPDLGYGEPPFREADLVERIGDVTPGESRQFEWLHRRKNGDPLWVEVSMRLAKLAGRECIITSARDITQRKRMEDELRVSRSRYRAYFHMLPDAAGVSRASDGQLIEVNQAFLDMFGWTREEAIGKTSMELGIWGNPENRSELLEMARGSGGAQAEYPYKNSKGETGIAVFCLRVFDEGNQKLLYFICKDITDRQRASDVLREQAESLQMANMQLEVQSQHLRAQQEDLITANKELEASMHAAEVASRAKSEFLTTMSHELLTPLTAILGYAEHLSGGSGDADGDPERAAAFESITRNGQQLTGILRSILDLAKIDAGEFKVESSLCSPRQILDEVHEVLRLKAANKSLELSTKVEGAFPASVETDPTRLRQVLMYLVDNAVKFTEEGEIGVTARILHQAAKRPMLEVEVKDTGVGMTEEVMGRLFQPFSQADMSYARKFQGTGMGLSICKRVCQLLGGDITVTSTPGQGSTFTATIAVDIPANALPAKPIPTKPAASQQCSGDALSCRILLAEDSIDNQRLFSVFIKKAGAELEIVDDGQQAVEAVAAAEAAGKPFDLVLMDMQMPVLDGYEATKRLRESGFSRPILAITAHGMVGDREKCLEAGCTEYATKPIKRDELISMIQTLLECDANTSG